MVTKNTINCDSPGIISYDGAGTFSGTVTTNHAVLVGNSSGTITNVGPGTTNTVLLGNSGGDPSFGAVPSGALPGSGQITLSNGNNITVSGSPVALGGTATINVSGTTNHAIQIGNASGSLTSISTGTTGQVLQANTGADPTFSTATYPSTATGTGTILRADGTNWTATTSTYPNTNAINTILYASSANVMGAITAGNDGVLVSSHTGVPSWLANGVAGQVLTANTNLPPSWQPAASGGVTSVSGTTDRITSTGGTTPVIDIAATYVGQTSITTLGTIATGTWAGTAITVDHGGTGRTSLTNHGVLVGAATTAITQLGAGSAGQVLQSGGASADPAYSTATYPSTAGTSGNVLTSNGTNWTSTAPAGTVVTTTYNVADSPGTWTRNANTKYIEVFIWAGGGGGGSGRKGTTAASSGGGAGGGAGFAYTRGPSAMFPSSASFTVGAGGTGGTAITGAAANGNNGTGAGNSTFGSITALAGGNGLGGTTVTGTGGIRGDRSVWNITSSFAAAAAGQSSGSLVAASPAANLTNVEGIMPSSGGGGGGGDVSTARAGAHGGDLVDNATNVNIILLGGLAGTADGGLGGDGNTPSLTYGVTVAATGGGGGGGAKTTTAGNGGNGAIPGGGGGGGGGGISGSFNSGAGGNGGAGRIIIIEYT